ncbi:hypothetical protein [Kurthia sibirica]|nr:hypothetical protein [Kurthia sibirica]
MNWFFVELNVDIEELPVLRSWNRYIMRHGEHIVFAEDAIDDTDI